MTPLDYEFLRKLLKDRSGLDLSADKQYLVESRLLPLARRANLAGIPGLALPCGFSQEGLPIGLQIQAPHFEEAKLLRLAHALEAELGVERPELAVDR